MSRFDRPARLAAELLARRGFEVRRHPAARRQNLFARHGVDLVLDVGAANGGYGRQLREFGYTGRIESFEPLRTAYLDLVAGTDAGWRAHHHALGAEAGEAEINVASNSNSSSLLPMLDAHREAAPEVDYVGTETITVKRLDDLDVLGTARAPFLKIDTQGFEKAVIEGGPAVIEKCVGIQLEISFVPLYEGGMLADEAIAWGYANGFRIAVIEQGYAAPTGEVLQMDAVFFRA
ncbi:FkbM family methyltransferase [Nocardioides sp. AE5]|uniref:FkbM family methyltransferase n=1 Tax=Nocardioides sp. AE5 TaxID=2962573 RepID=UPI0028814B65|nr:FkbM family methyltransferase [Nocardioides sp. AE5]MDT0202568.1 FkbM family methyltransferase [Nocardioides sp. AE5]